MSRGNYCAFPWNEIGSAGMSIREYFAAQAPTDPRVWFTPVMPTKRPVTPDRDKIEDEAVRADVRRAWECDTDPETPEGAAWIEMRNDVVAQQIAWDKEQAKQLCIQWPWAWADAVLAAGEKP